MTFPKLQPSTVIGIGAAAGTVAALIAHAVTHDITWTVAAGGAAAAVVHIVLPDNSNEPDAVNKLVQDAVTAAVSKNLAGALPQLLADGLAVANDLKGPAAATPAAPAAA